MTYRRKCTTSARMERPRGVSATKPSRSGVGSLDGLGARAAGGYRRRPINIVLARLRTVLGVHFPVDNAPHDQPATPINNPTNVNNSTNPAARRHANEYYTEDQAGNHARQYWFGHSLTSLKPPVPALNVIGAYGDFHHRQPR